MASSKTTPIPEAAGVPTDATPTAGGSYRRDEAGNLIVVERTVQIGEAGHPSAVSSAGDQPA